MFEIKELLLLLLLLLGLNWPLRDGICHLWHLLVLFYNLCVLLVLFFQANKWLIDWLIGDDCSCVCGVNEAATDDTDQSAAKQQQQQQQHESSSLPSGSAIPHTEDYESIPEDEWIASDMTMYDSPLAELERQHLYIGDTIIPVGASASSEPASTEPDKPTSSSPVNSSAW